MIAFIFSFVQLIVVEFIVQTFKISQKRPPYNLSHISYINETWCSYTLLKEDPEIYKSRDTSL